MHIYKQNILYTILWHCYAIMVSSTSTFDLPGIFAMFYTSIWKKAGRSYCNCQWNLLGWWWLRCMSICEHRINLLCFDLYYNTVYVAHNVYCTINPFQCVAYAKNMHNILHVWRIRISYTRIMHNIICKEYAYHTSKDDCNICKEYTQHTPLTMCVTYAKNMHNMCNIHKKYTYKTCITTLVVFVLFCFTYFQKCITNCDKLIRTLYSTYRSTFYVWSVLPNTIIKNRGALKNILPVRDILNQFFSFRCTTNHVQEMKTATQTPKMNFARTSRTVNLKILATEYSFVLYKQF